MVHSVTLDNLTFSYPDHAVPALSSISLTAAAGSFTLLCGKTGSGKTTLLRHLVPALTPHGIRTGSVTVNGTVGFVQQDPDNQIVTDLVFHELAFTLENQGLPTQTIRRRVAEIASFFGLERLLESPTQNLSGGQKQILNLAAALVASPDILVLDEPTSELDPLAAKSFLNLLVRANRELGTTIICCEHRLDDVLSLCDQVVVIEAGECVHYPDPQEFVTQLAQANDPLVVFLPEPTQIAVGVCSAHPPVESGNVCEPWPLDIKSGRTWLTASLSGLTGQSLGGGEQLPSEPQEQTEFPQNQKIIGSSPIMTKKSAVTICDLTFRYGKQEPFILKHLSAVFEAGKTHGIVGGNGSGKSTLLGLIAGIYKPQLGKLKIASGLSLAALPQNTKASFVGDTLRQDLCEYDSYVSAEVIEAMAERLSLSHLLDRHPYDLSGGERQKAALAKLLLLEPDILLLDEPTKGLDALAKKEIASVLDALHKEGRTIIIVTHDLPFAAACTHTCSLLANGELIATDETRAFFNGNNFYTTPTNRMTRGILNNCILVEDVIF